MKNEQTNESTVNPSEEDVLQHWHLEIDDGNIAWLTLDKQGSSQNTLSASVMQELAGLISQLKKSHPKGAVLLSAKTTGFIAGADVSEFGDLQSQSQALEMVQTANRIVNQWENLSFPTVAAIDGIALGGGLELALASNYIVLTDNDKTRVGLPEVLLGIHPGFGGTVRAIERAGPANGLDIILSGRSLRAKQALKMGLADKVVARRHLKRAAVMLIEQQPARKQPPKWNKLVNTDLGRSGLAKMVHGKVSAKANPDHYPAPYAVIDLWRKYGDDRKRMLEEEAKSISKLITSETSRNLVRVFFLQEELKALGKSDLVTDYEPKRVHVIGAGVMGGDIAAWCALRGLNVTVQDNNPQALARVVKRASKLFERKLREPRKVQLALDRFMPDVNGLGVKHADVIIEAIFENLEAKQGLFKSIEQNAKADAVLASNTSSIPLEDIAQVLAHPERLVGLHFFNPVAKMQLVEIVKGARSDQNQIDRALAFTKQISKLPVPVKSSPGFLVNRVLMPYLMEAVELHIEGVPGKVIDDKATEFGMPMGPVELADVVGLDICKHVAENLSQSLGGDVPAILLDKVEQKLLGKKSGQGFYLWDKKGKPEKPEVDKEYTPPSNITDRMILRYINEAVACLREGVVEDENALDGAMIFGTGFAPFRGGPMHYVRKRGAAEIKTRLNSLASEYGERFKPDEHWDNLIEAKELLK